MRAVRVAGHELTPFRLVGLAAGLLAFGALAFGDTPLRHYGEYGSRPAIAAGVTACMAIWWLSEALPIYATACVPLLVYPFAGVFRPAAEGLAANAAAAALPYLDPYNFLFLGGMCIAAAMQQWGLHRRIALGIMRLIGTEPARLLLGFLCATAFISLWISNTATAAMMVPIGIAVIAQFESRVGGRRLEHYGASVMLAIAYAANVGGIGTKIGTAPNALFAGFLARRGTEIGFLEYLAVGLPFVLLFVPVVWLALWRIGRRDAPAAEVGRGAVAHELTRLGGMQRGEWVVLGVFAATASLWIAGQPLGDLVRPHVTGFRFTQAHLEGGIAMLAAFALLAWPVRGGQALEVRSLRHVPFGTLLLLGGSFSMAAAIEASGLSRWLAERITALRDLAPLAQIGIASLATVALSSVASNVATVAVMLNVLANSVAPAHANPVLFAATISASCDFALPAGTPPNAIVFGSGYVTIPRMARTGAVLDLCAALLAAGWCWLVVDAVLGAPA
jgi:sodium-dependent dicarboxylate transporter 2/3/5